MTEDITEPVHLTSTKTPPSAGEFLVKDIYTGNVNEVRREFGRCQTTISREFLNRVAVNKEGG